MICPGSEYTDRLELKSATDRTFGIGVTQDVRDNQLMVLTATTLMKVAVDGDKVTNFHPS